MTAGLRLLVKAEGLGAGGVTPKRPFMCLWCVCGGGVAGVLAAVEMLDVDASSDGCADPPPPPPPCPEEAAAEDGVCECECEPSPSENNNLSHTHTHPE